MLLAFLTFGYNQGENSNQPNENLPAQDILNTAYGTDSEQKMDIYLPAGRNENTKVIILCTAAAGAAVRKLISIISCRH